MVEISIIIPAYNVAGYIEKCIESILCQTFRNIEIIIINDGSTDRTPKICDEYAMKDPRIRVIHKMNQGVSMARNDGIDVAIGKYILFYDGDDFIEPNTCQELYDMANSQGVDTIIYGYHRYYNGAIFKTEIPIFKEGIYERPDILGHILPRFVGISGDAINDWLSHKEMALHRENAALWRSMVSTDIIKNNNLRFDKNLKVGEDTIFISDYLSYSNKCYVTHNHYYYLVTRETSTIYVYEQKPMAKLEGKTKLLMARKRLTASIRERLGMDITECWQGTVVMSVIELAFLLSKKHPDYTGKNRYDAYKGYATNEIVQDMVNRLSLRFVLNPLLLPFLLLKWRWYRPLYNAAWLMNKMNFEFNRD